MSQKKRAYQLFLLFAVLAVVITALVCLVDVRPVGPLGTKVGLSHLNKAVHQAIGFHTGLYKLTEVLGILAILTALSFVVIGILEWMARKSFHRIDPAIRRICVIYILVVILYGLFEVVVVNCRPVIMPGSVQPEASFPSSHSMLATAVMGTAVIGWQKILKKSRMRLILQTAALVILALTVVGRLISGVHWFSDIVAGLLYGLTLVSLYRAWMTEEE